MEHGKHSKSEKRDVRGQKTVLKPVILTAGIFGILLVVRSIPQISFSEAVVFPAVLAVCASMYGLFLMGRKWAYIEASAILTVCGAAAAIRWDQAAAQARGILEGLTEAGIRDQQDITFLILLAGAAVSVCFFVLEILWNCHWLPYMTVTAVMAGAPVFGLRTGMAPAVFGLIFQILFWTVHIAERRTRRRSFREMPVEAQKTGRTAAAGKGSIMGRCSVFMGGILAVLVCISMIITTFWGAGLSEAVYSGEGFVSRSVQRITGRAQQSVSDGHISSGNNYRTGEAQLELTLLQQPEETLYLKGFTGGEYTGGDWEQVDETPLFHEMALALGRGVRILLL